MSETLSVSNPSPKTGVVEIEAESAGILTADLTKVYNQELTAVDKLSLNVKRGQLFGFLGPNGAGKTTTVGMLTTRVIPTGGKALVAGIDVVKHPALTRTKVAAVTQTNTLDRSLNVWENLYFRGRYFNMSRTACRQRADELLEKFRLTDRAKASIYALSGGLAQRVQIARALVHEPEVLFLDEPTAGLDPQSRLALWDTMHDLHTQGQTILLTTHYMEEADALCEQLAVMDHGKIVAQGTPAELKDSLGTERVATVTVKNAAGNYEAVVQKLEIVRSVKVEDSKLKIVAASSDGLVSALVTAISKAGGDVVDLNVAEPSLEVVFLSLTGRDLRE